MRWFITVSLVAVAALGVGLFALQDRLRPAATTAGPSADRLAELASPTAIRKVTLTLPGKAPLTLTRDADGAWSQPGNWPLRESEVAVLVNTLAGLKSRFATLIYDEGRAAEFGLAPEQQPIAVQVDVQSERLTRTLNLAVGQAPPAAGVTAFTRPCYLRVDGEAEVVQLGPDVYATLGRAPEAYRRRQLLPDVERVKFPSEGANPLNPGTATPSGRTAILGNAFVGVTVEGLDAEPYQFTLTRKSPNPEARRDPNRPAAEPTLSPDRLAQAWEFTAGPPRAVRDRPDPAKLKSLLTAVADLWVEGFLPADKSKPADTGLDKPTNKLTVTRADGRTLTLLVGKVTRTSVKAEEAPRPVPGMPPTPPRTSVEEFRAAKLAENDLVFELRADKLFAKPAPDFGDYRDARIARFEAEEVQTVAVALKGQPALQLVKKPGVKDAEREEDRRDRWTVNGDQLAESGKVSELVEQLARAEGKSRELPLANPDAAKRTELGLDAQAGSRVTLTVQPQSASGDAPVAPRTVTLLLGTPDATAKQLPVQVVGWDVVHKIDDAVFKLVERPALAYRSRRLFDTAELKLDTLAVARDSGEAFALKASSKPAPAAGIDWSLTAPLALPADAGKAEAIAGAWARLEATEFVDDAPKPEDLDKKYGLAKPRYTVSLGFTGPGATAAKPQRLELGAKRADKPEVYARLNGGGVLTLPAALTEPLDAGALALLVPQIWKLDAAKVRAIEITRGAPSNERSSLTKAGDGWKLRAPFEATLPKAGVDPLVAALAELQAAKFEAIAPKSLADYGLDAPAARVTLTAEDAPRTLLIGKPSADGGRYARVEGGPNPAVFTVAGPLPGLLELPALDRLDKALLALEPAKVNTITVSGGKPEDGVTLSRQPDGTWKAAEAPFAIDGPTVNLLANLVARPPVSRLAGYGAAVKWADFGLDKPGATVTVQLAAAPPEASKTHTLKLGKVEPSGERYLRVDDGPAVGVLPGRAAEALARTRLDFADRALFNFDPAAFAGLSRTRGKDEFALSPSGANWEVTKPGKQKADKPTVEELADALSKLRAVRVAAFGPAELAKPYGLAEPVATVRFQVGLDKPETKTLAIGAPVDAAKPDGDRYAMTEAKAGPKVVVVLDGVTAQKLLGEPIKFRDRALAKFVDADKLTLERGPRKATFAKVNGTWKLTEPVAADAEQGELDELVNALATLRADELVAEKPADLVPYGLKAPEARWQILSGDKPVLTLLLGKKDGAGRVHAMLDKGEVVALLDPALTAKVLAEYRKRAVWADVDASQLEQVIVTTASGNFALQKSGADWKDAAKPEDAFDAARVTELVTAFAGLKAERYLSDGKPELALYGLDKPARVIAVVGRAGVTKSLAVGGPEGTSGGKQRYAKVNDAANGDVFLLSEADTERLTRDRATLLKKK